MNVMEFFAGRTSSPVLGGAVDEAFHSGLTIAGRSTSETSHG
jgi:hypothetical protein